MGVGTLLIRADASPEIGTGHVMRCLALAQAWQDRGGRAVFFMAQSTPAISQRLSQEGVAVLACAAEPGDATDARLTSEISRQLGSEWLVLDGYRFNTQYAARLRAGTTKVLYVDDVGERWQHADIILNPNLKVRESQYEGSSSVTLLGTRYALLRREFMEWSNWKREIPIAVGNILVTLGGSTPEKVALCILEALTKLKCQFKNILFVIGASSDESVSLTSAARQLEGRITFLRAATNMAALMAQADVAIAAAGSTCWEMCFMGLPALIVDVADNQTAEALELHRQGYAKHMGNAKELQPEKLVTDLGRMLGSQDIRRQMSSRCRKLVDGRGAERVIAAMLAQSNAMPGSSRQEALA